VARLILLRKFGSIGFILHLAIGLMKPGDHVFVMPMVGIGLTDQTAVEAEV
jgi:hypothetical protein